MITVSPEGDTVVGTTFHPIVETFHTCQPHEGVRRVI